MGYLAEVDTLLLRPTQGWLDFKSVLFYYYRGLSNKPRIPIAVRANNINRYLFDIIDGHNDLAYCHLRNIPVLVWVAENSSDFLLPSDFPGIERIIVERNGYIAERFDQVPDMGPDFNILDKDLQPQHVTFHTIEEMVAHYRLKI